MRVIGLMSGTSLDAIDAAAADISLADDELRLAPLGVVSVHCSPHLRAAVLAVLPPATTTLEAVCRLDTRIGQALAEAAATALAACCDGAADLVASHGQTLYHWLDGDRAGGSLQVGQPAWIAERTGLPVVSDLRARDIAAGGHGAPLVSLFDALWLSGRPGVPAALNLGGIANLTVLAPGAAPAGFDVGPGNALLDAAAAHFTAGRELCDVDGHLAAAGRVLPDLLGRLLRDPYYARPAPKSTGKERFHLPYLLERCPQNPDPADVLATLTQLTARTVADACAGHRVTEVVASGGGTRNPTLMARLADALAPAALTTSDALGMPAQHKEAYAFSVLGFLTVHGLPGTLSGTTGARRAAVLGTITPGAGPLVLPAAVARSPRVLRIESAAAAGPGHLRPPRSRPTSWPPASPIRQW